MVKLGMRRQQDSGVHAAVLCAIFAIFCAIVPARADQNYSQQVFFENSLSPGSYYYSNGRISAPSELELIDGKLPVETSTFISAPNALKLAWKSVPNGGWSVEIALYQWRDRTVDFPGEYLWIWMYSPEGLQRSKLPRLALRDAERNFTTAVDLGSFAPSPQSSHFTSPVALEAFAPDLHPGKWTRVRIPLAAFKTASLHPFNPRKLDTLIFIQGAADSTPHTLYMDDIRIENAPSKGHAPSVPSNVKAKGYERHVDITWDPVEDANLAQYVIYRSVAGGAFQPIGVQRPGVNRFCDYTGDPHMTASYRVTARTSALSESAPSTPATASTHPMTDAELLDMVEEASFRYYWEAAEPHSGMTRENTPGDDDVIALGASGFGIMAIVAGTERGYVPRAQALERMQKITRFLSTADKFHGAWPHFLSGSTGHVLPVFGQYDNGADLVETSFLMEGLLTARQYFKNDGAAGRELYNHITSLWEGIEWNWFSAMPTHDALWWHWSPEYAFHIANRLTGWNEVMITYLEAIASPTHGVPGSLFYTGFAGDTIGTKYANYQTLYGIKLDVGGPGTGGPLFFTDYSFMGFDARGMRDKYTNYFENNRHLALINRAYCIENPNHWKGYGADTWGLTAVDGPDGYVPYEPTKEQLDDGTIAPTGAISAIAYTPEYSMEALRHFYRDLGAQVWDIYGFRDAFNLQKNWYSGITMGLNQAPMAVMIENHRSGVIWKNYMANPEIAPMLKAIGFRPDSH